MEQIRVATFAGPGAQPVIRTVPWPNIPQEGSSHQDRRLRSLRH